MRQQRTVSDGDKIDFCGKCGKEFVQRSGMQVTATGIFLCIKCYDEDRDDDGLWINDDDDDSDSDSGEFEE